MKKYILCSLFCLAILNMNANSFIAKSDLDSVKSSRKLNTLNFDMGKLNKNLEDLEQKLATIDLSGLESSLNIQLGELSMDLGEWANSDKMESLMNNLDISLNQLDRNLNITFDKKEKQQQKVPTRIEKKSFNNISEVEFIHQYGNIIVRSSNSSQIELEIQYFDTDKQKATCDISTKNKLLAISTNNTGKSGTKAKINYVISLPKNIALNINSRYGDVKMDKYEGSLYASLSYCNLSAESISAPANIKVRYSDIKIEEVRDMKISASYSDVRINKANRLELSGNYNKFFLTNVKEISAMSSLYTDFKIGTVTDMEAKIQYGGLVIDNVLAGFYGTTNYGDISIKSVSDKIQKVHVSANYADISISLPEKVSVNFDFKVNYGDAIISKRYTTKYTQSTEKHSSVAKTGQIGNGSPTGEIVIKNNYADIKIK